MSGLPINTVSHKMAKNSSLMMRVQALALQNGVSRQPVCSARQIERAL
jgi:hypothetical protein